MQNLSSCLKKQQNSTCIRATGMEIKTIDILPTSKCNCTLLSLSFNHISDLSNIKQFNLLTTLHLESNCIERISELEPLSHLPQLKTLSLSGNKVCCLPLFKAHIIQLCPQLQFLDGKNVSSFFKGKYSKEKFNQFLNQEKKCFKSIYINDFIAQALKSKKKNQKLTQDNLFSFFKSQNYQNTIHDLRLRSTNLSPSSYFNFLKQTMVALYHFIYKTSTLLELDKNLLLQYSGIIQSIEQENHFNVFLEKSQQLDSIALRLLKLTENYFDENTFNEFQPLTHPILNQKTKIVNRTNKKTSNSSDSISSQFSNSEENHNKTHKFELLSSKNKGLILNDDNDSASLSNDSNSHKKNSKKSLKKAKENIPSTNLINNQNNLPNDFEFLSNPLKTSSSENIQIDNKSKKNHSKAKLERIHEEEPASEETLPKCQQSVSSELSNVNHNEDANKSNLFLTELASEEIVSKSQQSFSEVNSTNLNNQINKIDKESKNTSTEIEADEISLENEKKNNNTDLHIHFLINQSNSPELASDEITQNTQSDSINQNKLNIHFPTSQVELASDEANQDSEVHTDSAKAMHSLSIEVASSSSSNEDEIFDQLSEGNENPNFKKNENKEVKAVQISTSLELASDETLPHSSIVHQQTSESDLQQNGNSKKNNNENDHPHHLKLPQSASLEFASDETLSNAQKSSSAFEDSESEGLMKSKKNQNRNKVAVNKNIHDSTKKSYEFITEEEELASEEGQNEDHAVLFDKKLKKIRLDTPKEKHSKASQESFSYDEMASGETLPSANPHSSDEDSEFESENKKRTMIQNFLPKNIKIEKEKNNHNEIISEDSDNNNFENDDADFEDSDDNNATDSSIENSSDFEKEKTVKGKKINTKVIPNVSPLFTYFKIWKMNYNFRIKRREMFKVRLMPNYNLAEKVNQNKEMRKKKQKL